MLYMSLISFIFRYCKSPFCLFFSLICFLFMIPFFIFYDMDVPLTAITFPVVPVISFIIEIIFFPTSYPSIILSTRLIVSFDGIFSIPNSSLKNSALLSANSSSNPHNTAYITITNISLNLCFTHPWCLGSSIIANLYCISFFSRICFLPIISYLDSFSLFFYETNVYLNILTSSANRNNDKYFKESQWFCNIKCRNELLPPKDRWSLLNYH